MLTKEDVMRAWDTSGRMLKVYRVRANLWDVANEFERESTGERGGMQLRIGVPVQVNFSCISICIGAAHPLRNVQIPKCIKGRSCKDALKHLHKSKKVWVETKYDGERAQIHVEVDQSTLKSRITIFSKSKRDSTMDRYGVHQCVFISSLGLELIVMLSDNATGISAVSSARLSGFPRTMLSDLLGLVRIHLGLRRTSYWRLRWSRSRIPWIKSTVSHSSCHVPSE